MPKRLLAVQQFRPLSPEHAVERPIGDAEAFDHVVVADDDVARRDRAHRELLVAGNADLAHDDHVEFEVERPGDLGGDGNAATWQRQHERIAQIVGRAPLAQCADEGAAGVDSITEQSSQDLDGSVAVISRSGCRCGNLRGRW